MTEARTVNRHTEATRNAIVAAAADLFVERRSAGFSVQEVADRAGLTHRTIYRYYPTRRDLIVAAVEHLAPGMGEDHVGEVSTVEEWIAGLGRHFAHTEANFDVFRALLGVALTDDDLQMFGEDRRRHDTHRWNMFRRQFPHVPDDEAHTTFASLRQMISSSSYVFLRLRFELTPVKATEAIQWAASQIVNETVRRDRAAERERKKG